MTSNERYDWGVADRFPAWAKAFAAELDPKLPELSPVFADLRGLPPLLVLSGEREMSLDQVNDFVRAAERDGVSVRHHVHPEMIHGFVTLHDFTPEAPRAFAEIGAFTADLRKR